MLKQLQHRLFVHLDTESWPKAGLSPLNKALMLFVLLSILSVILETEPDIFVNNRKTFKIINSIFLSIFTLEYFLRLWIMGCKKEYRGFYGRLKYIFSTFALIDLISILPFWFGLGSEWFLFRILRLLRILKLARIPGLSIALKGIVFAIKRRKFELYISIGLATLMMLGASTVLYIVEADIQPEAFGSIPRSLWWGMATLTTVGYGDVYPVTIFGKLFSGVFAFAGIGLVAMPTGILAAALSDSFQNAGKTLNDDN